MFCNMSNPFASRIELLILSLLKQSAGLYGLQLVHRSEGKLKQGTVHTTLMRLKERGLVNCKTPKSAKHPGLPRPEYTITEAGERVLKAWQEIIAAGKRE
jgi:DNA-binding PadR family transcriptional regulator